VLLSQCGPADYAGASWPLRAGPPVDQCVKLLSYLHVQFHDTLVGLPLAAFLGSHREATVFLCIVENHQQLGFGTVIMAMLPVLSVRTTEPNDCSTFLQSLECVDGGHATGYQLAISRARATNV
jgi:hypothetical protein